MCTGRFLHQLVVLSLNARSARGELVAGGLRMRCALGRSGRRAGKREGDGASPTGTFALRIAYYRADRLIRPRCGLPLKRLTAADGWCDGVGDRNYNRPVRHPYPASAERMWRADGLYDIVVVIGHNDTPRVQGRGSAIFLHCARPGYAPTEGCIAIARQDLLRLLPHLSRRTQVRM
jgi:L,D-peptidoglycan transpeptidase YkuD (ErfK/YbiS/YcfS/YnhG family)